MKFNSHISVVLACALLLAGCKATQKTTEVAAGHSVDSIVTHVVESIRTHTYLDSFSMSIIHHDTTINMVRVLRSAAQAQARAADTVTVNHRDTVYVAKAQRAQPSSSSLLQTVFVVLLGILFCAFLGYGYGFKHR